MWIWKREKRPLINLGAELVVEVHNHVLPQLDDGARTMAEAIQMLLFWAEMGYQKVIATPHHSSYFPTTEEAIEARLAQLRYQAQEQEIPILLTAAAEYLLEEELMQDGLRLRSFGYRRYVLIELGFVALPLGWERVFFHLQQQGYFIVLAHPERYPYASRSLLRRWYEQGLFLQINLLSLAGYYGPAERERAEYLLEKGWVQLVGSDAHRPEHLPYVREALTRAVLRKRLSTFRNPELL